MWLTIIVQLFPQADILLKVLSKLLEDRQVAHTANLIPGFVRQPGCVRIGELYTIMMALQLLDKATS